MGVIPGSSNPVPEGGNSPSVGGIGWMQNVTEQGVKDRAYNQVFPSMQGAKNSLFGNFIGGIFGGFLSIFQGGSGPSWLPSGVRDAAVQIRDGQLDLNDRQDLLDNLLNMGRTYCSATRQYSANTWTKMPFDSQLGVLRECEIIPGGIRLLKKGQWNIWAQVYMGNMTAPFATRDIEWEVRVYVPGASSSDPWKLYSMTAGRYKSNNPGHDVIITSVVTDSDISHVEVWAKTNLAGRTFGYGPSYNQLTVQQITSERFGGDGSENSGLPDDS